MLAAGKGPNHVALYFEREDELTDDLSAFIDSGLSRGEACVIIISPRRARALNSSLIERRQLAEAVRDGRYIIIDAIATLGTIMQEGMPDTERLLAMLDRLLEQHVTAGHGVRLYAELVTILWQAGNGQAVQKLEQAWRDYCNKRRVSVLCAYPCGAGHGRHERLLSSVGRSHDFTAPAMARP